MLSQLPLEFDFLEQATFTSYFEGHNKQLIYDLKKFIITDNLNELFIYLWGKVSSGKTHLLQAVCNYAVENNIRAIYIPLKNILSINMEYDFFADLEHIQLLCLDDIHLISNNLKLEERVFHLFNNLRAKNHKFIVSANIMPRKLAFTLLDLKSRMSWGGAYFIKDLTEAEKITALIMKASQIGLELKQSVAKFLLNRIDRSPGKLFATLKILDHASLAAKRKLTVPFVKEVLGL